MNKKERDLLGDIVAEMISSMESRPEVITYGKRLLRTFPSIKDRVSTSTEVELTYNLIELIRKNLVHVSTTESFNTTSDKVIHLLPIESDKLYDVLEELFEWGASDLAGLTNTLNSHIQYNNNRGIFELITSPAWCTLINSSDMKQETKDFYLGKFIQDDYKLEV